MGGWETAVGTLERWLRIVLVLETIDCVILVCANLLLGTAGRLDPVATLDNVGLEAYRSRTAVELEEETAGIAEDRAGFIASPERSSACSAVLAYGLVA